MTLEPGDILLTGCPPLLHRAAVARAAAGAGSPPASDLFDLEPAPLSLQVGDRLECSLDQLGLGLRCILAEADDVF